MSAINRRYDIDWLRVIAIGLLLLYHVAIGFQPWGIMIAFITNKEPWQSLWIPMAMLNVWRIPFLFFVSGMGVYFAMQQRSWKQLLAERSQRILLPFVFGTFCIYPISLLLLQYHYGWEPDYSFNPGHLWFLGNILVYVVALSPVFYYLKRNEEGKFVRVLKKILSHPLGLIPIVAAFLAEVMIVQPYPYELYAMTWHGFFLGLLAFFFGFCFVLCGNAFWEMLLRWRWLFLVAAIALYMIRLLAFALQGPSYLLVIESDCWIFSVLAFGYKYLNRPGRTLTYLSQAAYPVYIIHMIFLYLGSALIFPLEIDVRMKFMLVLLFTFAGCFGFYELVIRRVNLIRPLFGLNMKERERKPIEVREKVSSC